MDWIDLGRSKWQAVANMVMSIVVLSNAGSFEILTVLLQMI
jgi:hypothetical protein